MAATNGARCQSLLAAAAAAAAAASLLLELASSSSHLNAVRDSAIGDVSTRCCGARRRTRGEAKINENETICVFGN